jgi:hypothetical protein
MATVTGIYKILNKVNGKFYVGSSTNITKRWWTHKTELKNGKHCNIHLQSSWNLHGENSFEFSVVEQLDENTSDEELKQKEQVYLDECWDNGVNCYNMSKIADRPCPVELPVLQLNKTTKKVIREWSSATEVEKELGWARNNIGNCCRGILGTFKGYRWQYIDNSSNNYVLKETIQHGGHNKRKVVKVDPATGVIEEYYNSLQEAADKNNLKSYLNVLTVCNGTRQQTHGLVFRYLKDYQSVITKQDTIGYKCLVCNVSGFVTLKALATHIQLSHKPLTSQEYTVRYLMGLSEPPKCKICDNIPRYVSFSFKSYCKDHARLASAIAGSKPKKKKPLGTHILPDNIPDVNTQVRIYQLTEKGYSKDWWLNQKKLYPNMLLFYSDDWNTKQELIRSMIDSRLGKSVNIYDARKLQLVEDPELTKQFLELNHISGWCRSVKSFGLVEKTTKELVCLLTLRKPLHKEPDVVEIARFCSKQQSNVRGGFSRLLSASVKWSVDNNYTKIISYCDLNTGTGRVYEATGFKLVKENTGINYWYTDGTVRYNRFKFRAQPGKTEREVAEENSVYRVYGCGNSLYELDLSIK